MFIRFRSSRTKLVLITLVASLCMACQQQPNNAVANRADNVREPGAASGPTIEVTPISKTDDQWQVINSDDVTFKVNAPGAQSVKVLYRPAFEESRHVELKKINSPDDQGKFSVEFKVPSDFAGDVWAEASYRDGSKKETQPIALTVETISADELSSASYKHTDESAREDKLTGGHIETTNLEPGNGDIRITVNIPSFQLTLWQSGKEVKTYQIGIGRREFPLPSGLHYAKQIIFNPDWIPPDSSWVEDHNVVPGERVEADDPRNPLGKVKIPIGSGGILIHQAFRPSDIGHLVSHGCVRLQLNELYDLIDKIIAARSIKVSRQQLDRAKASKDRFAIKLGVPLIVDISYDTQVVEGGTLHLYPDVYNKKTNGVDDVRAELKDAGVDESNSTDDVLSKMLARVTMSQQFAISIADLKAGRGIDSGMTQPITTASLPKKEPKTGSKSKRR